MTETKEADGTAQLKSLADAAADDITPPLAALMTNLEVLAAAEGWPRATPGQEDKARVLSECFAAAEQIRQAVMKLRRMSTGDPPSAAGDGGRRRTT